ncbi:MAG TPA: helix-turn-helix domain-containing protein [Caulobacteraceae bacterium]|jgi:transcriptional regulator with XRE-family HTH domain|nr:helix-turn-helix domain-containing protein [Caulobacteraceae bacterium]
MDQTADLDRGPNPVDLHVGARIRMRRKLLGVSQERLADQLGLTFQQVQKYERGANRVSASKLYEIARALQTSVTYFFDGLADTIDPGLEVIEGREFMHDLVMTPEGLELAALFPKLKRGRVRRRVLDLVKALAEEEEDPVEGT